ncbi:HAD-IA family hydrolase [Brevundimonas naejangsanensis]|uniref:HAD-IA family hydrolase n=2 Tax=Brevundimonas naejangsanensis TaxID=588932 RepID=UPI0026EF44CC|nr:HAD-IA family hydrolase [Brevundimonas naejangsanensis]
MFLIDGAASLMKPTVLMVDVDGVVIRHPDPSGWSACVEEDLGVPRLALQTRFFKPCWDDVVHGRAALRDRLAPALTEIAPHVSCSQLIAYWFEGDAHLDKALLLQLADVRASGVPLHLATVQEHERASYLWNTLKLRDLFDDMHYAAQLGVSKPSQDFYAAVEERVSLPASAIAFIDDKEENVEVARARGWNAALWTPGATLTALIPELTD